MDNTPSPLPEENVLFLLTQILQACESGTSAMVDILHAPGGTIDQKAGEIVRRGRRMINTTLALMEKLDKVLPKANTRAKAQPIRTRPRRR